MSTAISSPPVRRLAGILPLFFSFSKPLILLVGGLLCIGGALGDERQRDAFVDSRAKFDGLLLKAKDQAALTKLCDGFTAALERQLKDAGSSDEPLVKSIGKEKLRVVQVKGAWLADPAKFRRVMLDRTWRDCRGYKEATGDFRTVMGVKPSPDSLRADLDLAETDKSKLVNKPILTPLEEFAKDIPGVKGKLPEIAGFDVGMSGSPNKSFHYYGFDGEFSSKQIPGLLLDVSYNRMYVVTDAVGQTVAVQFTCEDPKEADRKKFGDAAELSVYNFVQFRRKGVPDSTVRYDTRKVDGGGCAIHTVLRIEGKTKEINSLFLSETARQLVVHGLSLP
ncbi:hypothetical protein [Haloferula sp. BvORR071]|uniref:hypothetical protein n=1 Tax=Haloferula sp. BvORR071 TaxID=1396141 RepID=UPI0005547C3D|nr:hypothetical protein [Haloferula sp. BvORR071]